MIRPTQTCALLAAIQCFAACASVATTDTLGEVIQVDDTQAALTYSPAAATLGEPGVLVGGELSPSDTGRDRAKALQDQTHRDCTFDERVELVNAATCPAGTLLGKCTKVIEEDLDGEERVAATISYCIDAKPTS